MELNSVAFVEKLAYFLENKYFYIVEESNTIAYEGNSGCGYTENVGIAVLMLSYTYRPAYEKRFCNINPNYMNEYTLAAFALKFAQIYFENPSILRILMVCSCISELTMSFSRGKHFNRKYNYYLGRCLPFVLREVCFDYLAENGGEIALDAVAKNVSEGYRWLRNIIDEEKHFSLTPIQTALEKEMEKMTKTELEELKDIKRSQRNSENVCDLEKRKIHRKRGLVKKGKLICEEKQSSSIGNSKNDKDITIDDENAISNIAQQLHLEVIFCTEESSSSESSNIQNIGQTFDFKQVKGATNFKGSDKSDKKFNISSCAIEEIADAKPEYFDEEILYAGESSIAGSSNSNVDKKQTDVSKLVIDLGALELSDKCIDMSFGDIDDIADITSEFYEENLSGTEESSITYSSNRYEIVDMNQAFVSEIFSNSTIATEKCNKSIDMTFGPLDDNATIVPESYDDIIFTKESFASSPQNTSEADEMNQAAVSKKFKKSAISLEKDNKNIDMSFSDIVPEFREETLYTKESSFASSSNVQNPHETIDMRQPASAKLSDQNALENQDSCSGQATNQKSVKEISLPGVSKRQSKGRRRNRRANR